MKEFVRSLSKEPILKMNLQMFGEENDNLGDENEDDQPISFKNQSDLDSWYDKKANKALDTARAKWAKEEEIRINTAKTEAERLAALSAEEKVQEQERLKKEAEDKRLADITRRELRLEALEILDGKELPKELIDTIVLTDTEACKTSIEGVEKAFRAAVEAAVTKRLASSADNPSGNGGGNTKISIAEQAAKAANSRTEPTTSLWDQK